MHNGIFIPNRCNIKSTLSGNENYVSTLDIYICRKVYKLEYMKKGREKSLKYDILPLV